MTRVLFHEWKSIGYVDMSAIEDFRGGGEILRGDEYFRGDSDNLHDGGKNVRVSMNDDGFSHNDDENGENDEKGNDMTGCDDDEIRSVLICGDSHDDDDRRGKGDDEGNVQSDDDGNLDRKFRGKCF